MASNGLLTSMAITDAFKNASLKRDLQDQAAELEDAYYDIAAFNLLLKIAENELRKLKPNSAFLNVAVQEHAKNLAYKTLRKTNDFSEVRKIEFDSEKVLEQLEAEFQASKIASREKAKSEHVIQKSTWLGLGKPKFVFAKKSFSTLEDAQAHKDFRLAEIEKSTLLAPVSF